MYDPRIALNEEHTPRISEGEVLLNIHFWRETPVNRWSMEGRSGDFNVFRYDPLTPTLLERRLRFERN
jgi:hypothetical protein